VTEVRISVFIGFELYVGMKTPLGWIIFLIKEKVLFKSICNLNIFKPQLDDPEHPPMSIKKRRINVVKLPQILKSYVLKPLPVVIETILNEEILNA